MLQLVCSAEHQQQHSHSQSEEWAKSRDGCVKSCAEQARVDNVLVASHYSGACWHNSSTPNSNHRQHDFSPVPLKKDVGGGRFNPAFTMSLGAVHKHTCVAAVGATPLLDCCLAADRCLCSVLMMSLCTTGADKPCWQRSADISLATSCVEHSGVRYLTYAFCCWTHSCSSSLCFRSASTICCGAPGNCKSH